MTQRGAARPSNGAGGGAPPPASSSKAPARPPEALYSPKFLQFHSALHRKLSWAIATTLKDLGMDNPPKGTVTALADHLAAAATSHLAAKLPLIFDDSIITP